ncbi:MAG TPA: hypothetical protein VIJ43_07055 [Burkholderiales bacterium]
MMKIIRRMYASARNTALRNNIIVSDGPGTVGPIPSGRGADVACAGNFTD